MKNMNVKKHFKKAKSTRLSHLYLQVQPRKGISHFFENFNVLRINLYSEGKGSIYGALNPPPKYMGEKEPKERTKVDKKPTPRNIMTNPGKQGGYGYYHTTIGGKEYPYQSEPYGGVKKKGDSKPKTPSKPFISTYHGDRLFDAKGPYTMEGIKLAKKPKPAPKAKAATPFKAMSVARPTFNKFPEYKSPEKHREGPPPRKQSEKVWKPSGTSDFPTPSRSVCLHTVSFLFTILSSQIAMTGLTASTTFAVSQRH